MKYFYNCVDEYEILDIYKNNPYFDSWFEIVKNILESKEFQKRRAFFHHEDECLWTHCIKVSFMSYIFAKKHNLNEYNCAVAGLLHDFYKRAWYDSKEMSQLEEKYQKPKQIKNQKLFEKHAFMHPVDALDNSKKFYPEYMNDNIENAIATHMFPFSLVTDYKWPNNKESFVVWYIDKKISWTNLPTPKKFLKYVGMEKRTE